MSQYLAEHVDRAREVLRCKGVSLSGNEVASVLRDALTPIVAG